MSKARDAQHIQQMLSKLTAEQMRILRKALEIMLSGEVPERPKR